MSNNFEIKGTLIEVKDEQVFSDKFKKRDFVIRIEDNKYEQYIKFQTINDRCDLLDKMKAGQEVTVFFNLKGRPYNKGNETVYFTNLEAWRITSAQSQSEQAPAPALQKIEKVSFDDNDLPF